MKKQEKVRYVVPGESRFGGHQRARVLNGPVVKYKASPVIISHWEKEFFENSSAAFEIPKINDSAIEKEKDRHLRMIGDFEHINHPARGVVGMKDFLLEAGYKVELRKVRRLMRLMGIMPVCHRKHFSRLRSASYIRPYLLIGLDIDHRN